ncbi:MAG: hypothetical protein ACK5RL_16930, partial [Acidimicrobiales bacterium]
MADPDLPGDSVPPGRPAAASPPPRPAGALAASKPAWRRWARSVRSTTGRASPPRAGGPALAAGRLASFLGAGGARPGWLVAYVALPDEV